METVYISSIIIGSITPFFMKNTFVRMAFHGLTFLGYYGIFNQPLSRNWADEYNKQKDKIKATASYLENYWGDLRAQNEADLEFIEQECEKESMARNILPSFSGMNWLMYPKTGNKSIDSYYEWRSTWDERSKVVFSLVWGVFAVGSGMTFYQLFKTSPQFMDSIAVSYPVLIPVVAGIASLSTFAQIDWRKLW
jgi:hypothetical protein